MANKIPERPLMFSQFSVPRSSFWVFRPPSRFHFGFGVNISSVELFSLYSVIKRDHSSLLDENGKSD
jgi:hypothetical protein